MQDFTELYEVERRYEELAHKMSTPDAAANADEYARMMRDYKELTPLIEEYRRYTDLQQQEKDAKEMLAAESDPAFAAMVQQELCEIARNLAQSEENLRLLLIPKDADDEKALFWKFAPVPAVRKRPCLPIACGACTRCTPPGAAGSARPSAPMRQNSAA